MPSKTAKGQNDHLFLHSIVENIPNMVFIKDANELRFVLFNKAAEELLGYRREEMLGKNDYDFFPKEQADFFHAKDRQVLAGRRVVEIAEEPIHTRNGTRYLYTKKVPLLDAHGDPQYLLGISWDITDQKNALRETEEGRRYNRALFESAPMGLALCRMDGSLVDVNQAYADIIGYSIEETLRLTYWDITPRSYEVQEKEQLESLSNTGRYGPYEKEYIHKDGRRVPVRLQGIIIERGGQKMIWSSVEDISDRMRAQKELSDTAGELSRTQAEKEQLEVFAYLASHDLQEPLQKIIGFSELLKTHSKAALDAKGQDYIERIQNASRRMTQMIHDLLTFSRVATKNAQFNDVDLNEVVQDAITDLELRIERTGGRITVEPLPTVRADRLYMRQLFQNLIGNSLKFRRKSEPLQVRISGCELPGAVEISVEDNGIGFDQADAERVFKPFERLHGWGQFEGSGMGLAICQKIVFRHKGDISVTTAPNQGAKFTVKLPKDGGNGR